MSKSQRRATITREHILQSTIEIIQAHSVVGVTLDKVAENAGVSKGGLLYHFPTKEALIEGLMHRTFADFEALFKRHLDNEPPGNGRKLRAYIRSNLDESLVSFELATMLRAASLDSPRLKMIISKEMIRWRRMLADDGIPKVWVMIIRQAADAYWIDYLLGTHQDGHDYRQNILDELLKLTYREADKETPESLKKSN